ncbi:hypothetical protein N9D37_01985 [Erythrobacter sp.]|nr:hypothetical protein [Erythrobacter sp.]
MSQPRSERRLRGFSLSSGWQSKGTNTGATKRARDIWQESCQTTKELSVQAFEQTSVPPLNSESVQHSEVSKTPREKSKRGGARNRADRGSYALSGTDVAKSIAATHFATAIGLPFTRMITIHWESAGVQLFNMPRATGRFIDLLTKALARHGSRTSWVWVHENGHLKGAHCHILAHIPATLVSVVNALQRGWLRAITGKPYKRGVIHSKPIGGRLGLERSNAELHAKNLTAALCYLLKGATPEVCAQHGLSCMEAGGYVLGKRCGISQNVSTKARTAFASGLPSK